MMFSSDKTTAAATWREDKGKGEKEMKNRTFKAMAIGLAAVVTLTCVTPAAVFASASNDETGWVDLTDDDDDFYDDEDFDDIYDDDYDDEFYGEDENGEFHNREYFEDEDDFDDEDFDDDDDFDDDEDFVDVEEETGKDIVNNSHAGYAYANCRKHPGLDSEVLFTIPNGTRVYTTGNVAHRDGFDWYEVHLAGAYDYGWIAGHLIGR